MKLSCLILTKNNGRTLEYALKSIKPYADEIVLLDSGSDDDTVEIARKYTDRIFYHEFDGNFGLQRNYGMKQCRGEWIFMLDADEVVGENFARCIKYMKPPYRTIALPRCQIWDIKEQKQIITPRHYYDWQTRIVRNDGKSLYAGKSIHESIQNHKRRLHCCETNIFHLDFLINNYEMRKKKVDYYNELSKQGYPRMFLPEDYPYHTIEMIELPEKSLLVEMKENPLFNQYELHDSMLVTVRENIKWFLRQAVTRIRGGLSV